MAKLNPSSVLPNDKTRKGVPSNLTKKSGKKKKKK